MTRKSLRVLVPIALVTAAAPLLFLGDSGWRSPCACIPQNEMFAKFVNTSQRTLFDPEIGPPSVLAGLEAKVQGRTVDDAKGHPALSHARCKGSSSGTVCEIWLETKDRRERGYEIVFALSAGEKIQAVRKVAIIHRGGT